MKRLAKAAIVTTLRDQMDAHGSWAGETHLQKALFILQSVGVPLEYNFILYKHGPFAFDLRDELNTMCADRLLEVVPQSYPYGPRYQTTQNGRMLQQQFPKTLSRYALAIQSVSEFVGSRGVNELEKVGTALLMIRDYPEDSNEDISRRIRRVKPHIDESSARKAIEEVRSLLRTLVASESK
jgi:uncharacterized protein YwgA